MKLTELYVKNFRNYNGQHMNFVKPIVLFFGSNAQGKTNLLEAIYYLAAGKSHRAQKDKEIIRWETSGFYLKGELEKESGDYTLELNSQLKEGKNLKINGLTQSNLRNFLQTMNVVMFSPEDLMLVKGNPDNRRRFMNQEISQVDPSYDYYLRNYYKALRQRNKLLKTCQNKELINTYLEPWNEQLAYFGTYLIIKRSQIVHQIGLLSRLIYRKITNQQENLELAYSPSLALQESDKNGASSQKHQEKLLQALRDNLEYDLERRTTTVGPHRDDLAFSINGKDAKQFGSQGQQRSTVLALKMAELEMIKGKKGEYPILLLDDVLSELDRSRRKHLLSLTESKVQTFVTGTSRDDFRGDILEQAQIYRINEGEAVAEDAGN